MSRRNRRFALVAGIPGSVLAAGLLLPPAAIAGVRVTQPPSPRIGTTRPAVVTLASSFQLALGTTFPEQEYTSSPGISGGMALERQITRSLGMVVRAEHARFEARREDRLVYAVTPPEIAPPLGPPEVMRTRTQLRYASVELGGRVRIHDGAGFTWIDAAGGIGHVRFERITRAPRGEGDRDARFRSTHGVVDFGIGHVHQPAHWPVGLFIEGRVIAHLYTEGTSYMPVRVGIAGWPLAAGR